MTSQLKKIFFITLITLQTFTSLFGIKIIKKISVNSTHKISNYGIFDLDLVKKNYGLYSKKYYQLGRKFMEAKNPLKSIKYLKNAEACTIKTIWTGNRNNLKAAEEFLGKIYFYISCNYFNINEKEKAILYLFAAQRYYIANGEEITNNEIPINMFFKPEYRKLLKSKLYKLLFTKVNSKLPPYTRTKYYKKIVEQNKSYNIFKLKDSYYDPIFFTPRPQSRTSKSTKPSTYFKVYYYKNKIVAIKYIEGGQGHEGFLKYKNRQLINSLYYFNTYGSYLVLTSKDSNYKIFCTMTEALHTPTHKPIPWIDLYYYK